MKKYPITKEETIGAIARGDAFSKDPKIEIVSHDTNDSKLSWHKTPIYILERIP